MDLYTKTSYELSRSITLRYSTSFSRSTKLFSESIQPYIFAIYGLVRIADETVDTYTGKDRGEQLDLLRLDVYRAMKTGYSTNPIVHAFADTARRFSITKTLIEPFFESMRMDITPKKYTPTLYATYIYGSAEVIGLMCLRVFVDGNDAHYKKREAGARALGAAYQKVNFLRDIASDYRDRQRIYFPDTTFSRLSEADKIAIVQDIRQDFAHAKPAVTKLPKNARKAVTLSFLYYSQLLDKLERTPVDVLKQKRVRLSGAKKLRIAAGQIFTPKGRK